MQFFLVPLILFSTALSPINAALSKFFRGISLFIFACPSRILLTISVSAFVPVGFLHVLYSGDGRGESLGAGADRQCLHLQAGQATRALEVRLLHVPARWVSLLIFFSFSFNGTLDLHSCRKYVSRAFLCYSRIIFSFFAI